MVMPEPQRVVKVYLKNIIYFFLRRAYTLANIRDSLSRYRDNEVMRLRCGIDCAM